MLMIITAGLGGILALCGFGWRFLPLFILAATLAGALDRPPNMEVWRGFSSDMMKVFAKSVFITTIPFGVGFFIHKFVTTIRKPTISYVLKK